VTCAGIATTGFRCAMRTICPGRPIFFRDQPPGDLIIVGINESPASAHLDHDIAEFANSTWGRGNDFLLAQKSLISFILDNFRAGRSTPEYVQRLLGIMIGLLSTRR